jgi:DNA replication protein DnaC
MSISEIDTARLPLLLQELRLPAIARSGHGSPSAPTGRLASCAAASVLAELEIAERGRRRIERHLAESRLLPGKMLDNFDFDAVPMLSKQRLASWHSPGDAPSKKKNRSLVLHPQG